MKLDYITTNSPWPGDSGGRLRVGMILDSLRRHAVDVRPSVLGDDPGPVARRRIERQGGRIYPRLGLTIAAKLRRYLLGALRASDPTAALYLDRPRIEQLVHRIAERQPEAVLLDNIYLTPLLPALRRAMPGVRVVIDNHNVESLLLRRLRARTAALPARLQASILARTTEGLERQYLGTAQQVWACSQQDAAHLSRAHHLPRLYVIPNAVDTREFAPDGAGEEPAIVFTGCYWYAPNQAAAHSLIESSIRLRSGGLEHELYLVGQAPTAAMAQRARLGQHIVITGAVADVRPFLAQGRVFAAPLTAGSGTKHKLLQAMAAGMAIVTTKIGAEGLRLTDGVEAIIVDEPTDFEQPLARLLRSPAERARLGAAARAHVVRYFSRSTLDDAVGEALEALRHRAPGLSHGSLEWRSFASGQT